MQTIHEQAKKLFQEIKEAWQKAEATWEKMTPEEAEKAMNKMLTDAKRIVEFETLLTQVQRITAEPCPDETNVTEFMYQQLVRIERLTIAWQEREEVRDDNKP